MTILNKNHRFNVDMSYREEVLTSITMKIEEHLGRLKPSVYEYREYERNKTNITERLKNLKHLTEKDMPDWEKVLLKDINLTKNKDDFDDISSDEYDHMAYRDKVPMKTSKFADQRM